MNLWRYDYKFLCLHSINYFHMKDGLVAKMLLKVPVPYLWWHFSLCQVQYCEHLQLDIVVFFFTVCFLFIYFAFSEWRIAYIIVSNFHYIELFVGHLHNQWLEISTS